MQPRGFFVLTLGPEPEAQRLNVPGVSLAAARFAWRRRLARDALGRLRRLGLRLVAASSFLPPPRSRSAAARSGRRRPSASAPLRPVRRRLRPAARGLNSLPTSSTCATSARVAPAEAQTQQAGVAARTRLEARRERVEQLGDDLAILHVLHHQAARVEGLAVGVAGRDPALGDGDQPLDERPQFLRRGTVVSDARDGEEPWPGSAASKCDAR